MTGRESLFPSLRSIRQKAEDRAKRYDELADTDDQYLALVKVNPHVLLALLDAIEAAQEYRINVLTNGDEDERLVAEQFDYALSRFTS